MLSVPRIAGIVSLCAIAVLPAAVADGATPNCRTFERSSGATRTADVAQVGSQLRRTEYFPAGVYTTAVCDADGTTQREVTMSPYKLPNGTTTSLPVSETTLQADGTVKTVEALRPADLSLDKGDWRKSVTAARKAGLPALQPAKVTTAKPAVSTRTARRTSSKRTTGGPWKCAETGNAWSGNKWASNGIGYYTNFGAFGAFSGFFVNETQNGFHTWQFMYNTCSFAAPPAVAEVLATANLGTTSASFTSNDGINVVDGGTLTGGCSGALACTVSVSSAGAILDADIRLNTAFPWTIGASAGYYDIWSAIAHEAGHAIGFGHSSWNDTLVMYPIQEPNDTSHRYLGLGDYNILHYIY